jgi:hypothetical protein
MRVISAQVETGATPRLEYLGMTDSRIGERGEPDAGLADHGMATRSGPLIVRNFCRPGLLDRQLSADIILVRSGIIDLWTTLYATRAIRFQYEV